MRDVATQPDDLERLFVDRANAGDVDGLVALYEPNAILVAEDGLQAGGTDQIRAFFVEYLRDRPRLAPSMQHPALAAVDLALTSSRHSDGTCSVEIARRQADGTWLWVVDKFAI